MAVWTEEKCLNLIVMWENYPCLFDTANPDYVNRNKAKNALVEIACALGNGITEDDVKQKMRSLRNSFLQQLSAYNARCRSGASAQHVAEPTWRFWKALCFLRPFIKLRKGQDNLSSTSANCSQSSELLVPEEETGDISALLTSMGAFAEKRAEAPAAPASPNVYQQAPSPKAPDCAKRRRADQLDAPSPAAAPPSPSPNVYQQTPSPKAPDSAKRRRRADNLDNPSPAHQALEILKNLLKKREEKTGKATANEMFYQTVALMTENFPEYVQDQLHRDILNMVHDIKQTF